MNTADLIGYDLDYWTGLAMKKDVVLRQHPREETFYCWEWFPNLPAVSRPYRPTEQPDEAFEVLETFEYSAISKSNMIAQVNGKEAVAIHESLLVRICRCKVALVFGNNVETPPL